MTNAPFQTVQEFFQASAVTGRAPNRIVHCVNPFPAKLNSEHHRAQSVTLASMAAARTFARCHSPDLSVDLVSVTLPGEEVDTIGIAFTEEIRLERSILDIRTFNVPRQLPLIFDILSAPAVAPDDILVYTNIDISLTPQFYIVLAELFARGADCAVINRRTISNAYHDPDDLALMALEVGTPHPGFDCFAFRGKLRDSMVPFSSCIGIGGVMLPLLYNLLALAEAPTVLLDAHATFHIGDDKSWRKPDLGDYSAFNSAELDRVFDALQSDPEIGARLVSRLQGAHLPWVFPDRLRARVGIAPNSRGILRRGSLGWIRSRLGRAAE